MKNLIHRPVTRFGLPYHGLVTNGQLSTPGGNIPIAHQSSTEGAIVFKTRNPPGNTPNAAQAALDAVHGWEWRDYVILNGRFRSIGDGGTRLGAFSWLYCDTNDVVWKMSFVKEFSGDVVTIKLWRDVPFGRFYFGFDREIEPELLHTWSFSVPETEWVRPVIEGGGVFSATAQMVAQFALLDGSGIVPNVHGDQVYLHVLSPYFDGFPETAGYFSTVRRSVLARAKFTIYGNGDLNNNGLGISAAISEEVVYPWWDATQGQFDWPADQIDPWPINHIEDQVSWQYQCQDPPTGPGQTCTRTCNAAFTHEGVHFSPGLSTWGEWAGPFDVFLWHGGSVQMEVRDQHTPIYGYNVLAGAGMSSTEEFVSYELSPPNDGFYAWEQVSYEKQCSKWTEYFGQDISHNSYKIFIDGITDQIELTKTDTGWSAQGLGVGTSSSCSCVSWLSNEGFPNPSRVDSSSYTFTEPFSVDSDSYQILDDHGEIKIFPVVYPGMIGYVAVHPTTDGLKYKHRGKMYGIGSDGTLTLITTWDVLEAGRVVQFPWSSIAWQPETKEFNVQTDGTLVKYI